MGGKHLSGWLGPSADNVADLFTKPLARDHHHRFLDVLNIR